MLYFRYVIHLSPLCEHLHSNIKKQTNNWYVCVKQDAVNQLVLFLTRLEDLICEKLMFKVTGLF